MDAREVDKRAEPLATLLRRHHAPHRIDDLSLEVEGSEYEILKDFPFDEYTFVALTIEGASCDRLLADIGYCRVVSPWCEPPWEHFFVHPGTEEGAAVIGGAASGPV